MNRISRYLNVAWIVLLSALFIVPVAFAQDGTSSLLAPFAPVMAASVTIERLLQLIRNAISPDPDAGLLKRGSKELRYYTTFGGVALGLIMAFLSGNLRLLELVEVQFNPLLDTILTGVVIGMGTEVVHELIKVLAEGKDVLRKTAKT